MSGRVSVAPCGHHGEYIIGNYIKCLAGCDTASVKHKMEVRVIKPPRRGTAGHVDECDCVPCQVRKSATRILLRTQNGGTLAEIPWDGVTDTFTATINMSGTIKGFWFVDNPGNVIAQGTLSSFLDKNWPVNINIDWLLKAVK